MLVLTFNETNVRLVLELIRIVFVCFRLQVFVIGCN
jgi:hypothetical protein